MSCPPRLQTFACGSPCLTLWGLSSGVFFYPRKPSLTAHQSHLEEASIGPRLSHPSPVPLPVFPPSLWSGAWAVSPQSNYCAPSITSLGVGTENMNTTCKYNCFFCISPGSPNFTSFGFLPLQKALPAPWVRSGPSNLPESPRAPLPAGRLLCDEQSRTLCTELCQAHPTAAPSILAEVSTHSHSSGGPVRPWSHRHDADPGCLTQSPASYSHNTDEHQGTGDACPGALVHGWF